MTVSQQPRMPKKVLPNKFIAGPGYRNTPVCYQASGILEWVGQLAVATERAEYHNGIRYPEALGGSHVPLHANIPEPMQERATPDAVSSDSSSAGLTNGCSKDWSLEPYIAPRDPRGWQIYASLFDAVSVKLEARNKQHPEIRTLMQTIRKRLEIMLDRVVPQGATMNIEPQLRALYEDILHSLQLLLCPVSPALVTSGLNSPATKPSKAELPKEASNTILTRWLRANWINPYPDEQCLAELAAQCGKDTDKICTWVGNARARKWRPALNQAVALGRPADSLLQDSLAIFDGRPINGVSYKRVR